MLLLRTVKLLEERKDSNNSSLECLTQSNKVIDLALLSMTIKKSNLEMSRFVSRLQSYIKSIKIYVYKTNSTKSRFSEENCHKY